MASFFKKNRECDSLVEEYLTDLTIRCELTIKEYKNPLKIADENIIIPTINQCNELNKYKYTVAQLKQIAKHYKLKMVGTRPQLYSRIYCFLYWSSHIIKIQNMFRRRLAYNYKILRGPAVISRKLCTNNNDFITMEPVEEIPFNQFISYKDTDGFIYGFDINSLHNLFMISTDDTTNPYNRKDFPKLVLLNLVLIVRLSKILNHPVNLIYEDDTKKLSPEKAIELRAITIFQSINALGNYSNADWFLSLNKIQLIHFVKELIKIWGYRAQLSIQTKINICPPTGDPFRAVNLHYLHNENNVWNIKRVLLDVMEKMINNGIDNDSKSLGAYYILGSLTLVNTDAATALPWLFQSVCYFD
jgi:hypothetical protein